MTGLWEVYNKDKTYYDEKGQEYGYDRMLIDYPIVAVETVIVKTTGSIILERYTVNYLKSLYNIINIEDPEKVAEQVNFIDTTKQTETPALERIAAVLEYFMMEKYDGGQSGELS